MLHLPVSNANSQLSVELYELFTRGFAVGEESMPGLVDTNEIDGTQDEPPIPKPTGKAKAATQATNESSGKGQPPMANKKGKPTAAKKATDESNGKDEPPIANKKRKSTATLRIRKGNRQRKRRLTRATARTSPPLRIRRNRRRQPR
jgi:hypothetical protein